MILVIKTVGIDPTFINKVLPKMFLSYTLATYKKNQLKYVTMDKFLREHYKMTLPQAIKICCKNYTWRHHDDIAAYRPNADSYYKTISIQDLQHIIDDGNLSIRGTHLFDDVLNNIKDNLKGYYRTYRLTKGSRIWQ